MSNDIQSRFDEVKRSYINNLKEKKGRITQLWNGLSNDWQAKDFEELHLIVHSIAGGAETFGFAEVSQIARTAVNLIRDLDNSLLMDKQSVEYRQLNVALSNLEKILSMAIEK